MNIIVRKSQLIRRKFLYSIDSRCLASTKAVVTNFDYCANLVKTSDYESYLTTLLLPKEIIRSAFAIRAFNVELANISSSVRDPKLALIRTKFWKDCLDGIYKPTSSNEPKSISFKSNEPIINELEIAIKSHKLSKQWLSRLITSREEQFKTNSQYSTYKEVENFGEMSVASIYYLLLECMGVKNMKVDHVASHIGKAQILANLIRSIPVQSKNQMSLIPLDMLVKHKISQNEIISKARRGKIEKIEKKDSVDDERLHDLVFDICNMSNQHLIKARKHIEDVPANKRSVFLHAILVQQFLNKIEKFNFDIYNPRVHSRDTFIILKLYLAKFKKVY